MRLLSARFCLAFCAQAFLLQPCSSQTSSATTALSEAYSACMEKSEGVTSEMRDCTEQEARRLEARLTEAYRKALASIPASRRGLLREAQRAWIRYRDTTCSMMTQLGDRGTSALLADDSCHLLATAERVRWLESIPLD
jgi:uncharacterized protein YecT (DUF1311 family)